MKARKKRLHFFEKYSNINRRFVERLNMQRCLSGLRSTIGNRVMRERIRRFKSSSLRQKNDKILSNFVVFLSKPQAWYELTRQRVWHHRRYVFLRLDFIRLLCHQFHTATSCGFHTRCTPLATRNLNNALTEEFTKLRNFPLYRERLHKVKG